MYLLSASLRRHCRFLWLWAFAAMVCVGCQTVPEDFTVSAWTPIAAVPLVDTRFDLSDVLEVLIDSLDTVPVGAMPDGELAYYHEQNFSGSIAEEWLILPSYEAASSFVLGAGEAAALNLLPEGGSVSFQEEVSSGFEITQPQDAVLSRVDLSSGVLTFTLTTTMGDDLSGVVAITGLVDPDEVPYEMVWNSGQLTNGSLVVSQDLAGWSILPEQDLEGTNIIQGEYTFTMVNTPDHDAVEGEFLICDFVLSDMAFERAVGDFGTSDINLEEEAVSFALFDDRFTTSGLEIERASLRLEVENGFGVDAVLDSLDFTSSADGTADVVFETTAEGLFVPSAEGSSAFPTLAVWEIDETNSNVVDFFSAKPRDIDLSMRIRCNPDGPVGPNGNFLDADGFVSARLMTEIPLSIRAEQIDFVDTVDVDIEIEEEAQLDSAELRLILHNGFPFEVAIRASFLNADGEAIDSLSTEPLDLFTLPLMDVNQVPVEPGVFVYDFFLDWERAEDLRSAERVVMEAWVETADAQLGEFVRITEEQGLRMELGLLVYAKIDL